MTKKQMEKRILDLEREIVSLKDNMLALAMRPSGVIVTQPLTWPQPAINPWPQQWPTNPIITWESGANFSINTSPNYGGIQ